MADSYYAATSTSDDDGDGDNDMIAHVRTEVNRTAPKYSLTGMSLPTPHRISSQETLQNSPHLPSPLSSRESSSSMGGSITAETINTSTVGERRWALAVFSLTTILLFADQNLMSPNLTTIADDFGLDAVERDKKLGGDISLAFFLLGAPASFLVGFLADTFDRSVVFALTVVIGECACLATYWVQTYSQLYVCRAITGFSLGGALPVIYSVLG
jgi:hypothetical protein